MKFTLSAIPKKPSPLAAFFLALNQKIFLYQQNNKSTIALYQREHDEKKVALAKQHQEDYAATEKRYDEIFAETEGEDEWRHRVALYESGMTDIDDAYDVQEDHWLEHYDELYDYFNKSSLIIFYSLMESELKRLCEILKELKGTRISVADFASRNYIKGSFKYLDLVIDLPKVELDKFEERIEHFQYVRNRIAHTGAEFELEESSVAKATEADVLEVIKNSKLPAPDPKPAVEKQDTAQAAEAKDPEMSLLEKIVAEADGLLMLMDDEYEGKRYLKIIDPGYIDKAYRLLRDLFDTLFILIEKQFNYPLLKERLEKLFRPYYGEMEVTIDQVTPVSKGNQFAISANYQNEQGTKEQFSANITLAAGKKNELTSLNQMDGDEQIERMDGFLTKMKEQEIRLATVVFPEFADTAEGLKMGMTFYPAT